MMILESALGDSTSKHRGIMSLQLPHILLARCMVALVFVILSGRNCAAQSCSALFDTLAVDWAQFELESDSNAIANIRDSISLMKAEANLLEMRSLDHYMEGVHFIDINSDVWPDAVLNAYYSESEIVVMWLGSPSGYRKIYEGEGRITAIYRVSPWTPISFRLYNYGCCAEWFGFFEDYVPTQQQGNLQYQLCDRIVFRDWSLPNPSYFAQALPFRIPSKESQLRWEPKIDDTPNEEFDDYGKLRGNMLATYAKGASGVAVGETTDSTGAKWYFVLMDVQTECTWSLDIPFQYGNSTEHPRFSGWIEAKQLVN